MGKRQEAALETRQKLIDAMRNLLQEKEADSIGIEEITVRAGVAKGTFYTYFKRKEDVISVIAMECYQVVRENALQFSGGVYEQLCSYLRDSAKIIKKNTLQIAQNWIKSVAAPLPEEQGDIDKYRFDYDNIMEMVKRAIECGELRPDAPCILMTRSIMNSYYGAVLSWCITKAGSDLTLRRELLPKFLIRCGFTTETNNPASERAFRIGSWYLPVHSITILVSPSSDLR